VKAPGLLLLLGALLPAQVLVGSIPLGDGDPIPDNPFGITLDPDGRHAYVAISGNYIAPSQNNRRLRRIDLWQGTSVASALVGWFPEDIAVVRDAAGAAARVVVTASTGNSVHILDPGLAPMAQQLLPPCPVTGSHFPFGVAVSEDGTRALVTTLGGCSSVFLIDIDPVSPGFGTIAGMAVVPDGHNRPLSLPGGSVFVGGAAYGPGLSLSYAVGALVDPMGSGTVTQLVLLSQPTPWVYAAIADAALLPDGGVLALLAGATVPALLDLDAASLAIRRTLPLPVPAGAQLHGLALDPAGEVAAVAVIDADLVLFVEVATGALLGSVATGAGSNPNEVVFMPDGASAFVTLQGREEVVEMGRFPWRRFQCRREPPPAPGHLVLALHDGQADRPYLLAAGTGVGLADPSGFALEEPLLLASGNLDPQGRALHSWPLPAGLVGSAPVQALHLDRHGLLHATRPLLVTVP
jgi:DNA-binding beta-propeller fold protein YncE